MSKYKIPITIAAIIIILLIFNHLHYEYEKDNYPISFAEYLVKGYWFQEPTDAELDPTSALYMGN